MTTVMGIDPSLTRTAVAVIQPGLVTLRDFPTRGTKGDTLLQRGQRLNRIAAAVTDMIREVAPIDLIVIEGPAHGQVTGSHHDRSGLWWRLVADAQVGGIDIVAEVTPTALKTYATGKGNTGKDEVMLAVARRYAPVCEVANNDQADALALADAGWHHLTGTSTTGTPMPQTHQRALAKVAWPAARTTA